MPRTVFVLPLHFGFDALDVERGTAGRMGQWWAFLASGFLAEVQRADPEVQ